jgi:hypothetical protein
MPSTTSPDTLPYLTATEPPAIHTITQALATATQTALSSIRSVSAATYTTLATVKGTLGAYRHYGDVTAIDTNSSGVGTIGHGMGATPQSFVIVPQSASVAVVINMVSVDATHATFVVWHLVGTTWSKWEVINLPVHWHAIKPA